ncbi:MAG: hypothetical protein KDG50_09135 [Chromatiales bacterium]|nr:hypothetical protein [Chromatiales bacterium]
MKRRSFLQTTAGSLALTLPGLGGLLYTPVATAGPTETMLAAESLDAAMRAVTGDVAPRPDPRVEIDAPAIAENGRSVPVKIRCTLDGVRALYLFSEKNQNPGVARFALSAELAPVVKTRIKMGGTGRVIALAELDSGFLMAERMVTVTSGGCS